MTGRKMILGVLLAAGVAPPAAFSACLVNDADFDSAGGGCKDLDSGLVWSQDVRAYGVGSNFGYSASLRDFQELCDEALNESPAGAGFADWRAPTLGEVEEALANGLFVHLDYYSGGTPQHGEYYWTQCQKRVKGTTKTYAIGHDDGDILLTNIGGNHLLCVRGLAADPANDCPGKKKGGGKGGNNSALSQAVTGATLLAPLCLVGMVCFVKRRR